MRTGLIARPWCPCSECRWSHRFRSRLSHLLVKEKQLQARACNTLAFRAVARWATHRHRVRRPAPWPRARTGARTARCRGGGGVGLGNGCRRRHRSGGDRPAWRNAHGRGRHPAAQRTCTRRAGRPTRRTGGRVGPTAARRGASNSAASWRQQPPTRRRNRSRRAGTITRGSSWARRTPEVAARGRRAQLGAVGGARGQAPSGPSDPCGRTVLLSHATPFAFSVIATLATLTRPQIPEYTNADCHL